MNDHEFKPSSHWQERLSLFRSLNNSASGNGIVFTGDSLTEEFDLELYFPGRDLINRGISGDRISGLLERFDLSVAILKPALLFVMIGINDLGDGMLPRQMKDRYLALLNRIAETLPETRVVIQALLPFSADWPTLDKIRFSESNRLLQSLVQSAGFTWLDFHNDFCREDGFIDPQLTNDGLHLNHSGYEKWAKRIEPLLPPNQ